MQAIAILSTATVLTLPLLGTACGPKKPVPSAPVPEATRRLEYTLRIGADRQSDLRAALDGTVCLLRSDEPEECADPYGEPTICTARTETEIREAFALLYTAIGALELTSPFTIDSVMRAVFPDVKWTIEVDDARRTYGCRQWASDDGACIALRIDKAWVLLHAPPQGGLVDTLEVFKAETICDPKPN
jgi:hypothetical protein